MVVLGGAGDFLTARYPYTWNFLGLKPDKKVHLVVRNSHTWWSVVYAWGRHCESRSLNLPWTRLPSIPVQGLQGILAHKKVPLTRTLQKDIPRALRWPRGQGTFL